MNTYRYHANRQPELAKYRAGLARTYRTMRAENPLIARLLFVRLRNAKRRISEALMNYAPSEPSLDLWKCFE